MARPSSSTSLAVPRCRFSDEALLDRVRHALEAHARVVLAVSGGVDSMVLLETAARTAPERIAAVATFDHGTGAGARRAVQLVRREARRRGLPVVDGAADGPLPHGEAAWRTARWRFLRSVALARNAVVATAHTRDDQVETVAMRILRQAGARGIAGLFAESDIVRPLLAYSRADLARYAVRHGVRFLEDPTNASRAHLRNRLRLDVLPALVAVRPGLADELLELARRAADWRRQVDALCAALPLRQPDTSEGVAVDTTALAGLEHDGLAMLWPAIAARLGVALDRRGVERAARFVGDARVGARIQLSGGYEVLRTRDAFVLRRGPRSANFPAAAGGDAGDRDVEVVLRGRDRLGPWSFDHDASGAAKTDDLWIAWQPPGVEWRVRSWRGGDRIREAGAAAPRRVKRYFADHHIVSPDRAGWPVVLAEDEIVWVPGVCRSAAATDRSGRPAVRCRRERFGG